jgi:hypothetical protein
MSEEKEKQPISLEFFDLCRTEFIQDLDGPIVLSASEFAPYQEAFYPDKERYENDGEYRKHLSQVRAAAQSQLRWSPYRYFIIVSDTNRDEVLLTTIPIFNRISSDRSERLSRRQPGGSPLANKLADLDAVSSFESLMESNHTPEMVEYFQKANMRTKVLHTLWMTKTATDAQLAERGYKRVDGVIYPLEDDPEAPKPVGTIVPTLEFDDDED